MKKILLIASILLSISQANSFTTTKYIKVKSSRPFYKTIITKVPVQNCWDETVPVRDYTSYNNNSPVGAIIGGVTGGIIGHQIGRGRGKSIATLGGAVIGTIIGENLAKNSTYRRYDNYQDCKIRKRCETHYIQKRERRFVGYKNIAYFKGRKIVKITNRRLDYIPLTIKVIY